MLVVYKQMVSPNDLTYKQIIRSWLFVCFLFVCLCVGVLDQMSLKSHAESKLFTWPCDLQSFLIVFKSVYSQEKCVLTSKHIVKLRLRLYLVKNKILQTLIHKCSDDS